jgi:hypothetical protein
MGVFERVSATVGATGQRSEHGVEGLVQMVRLCTHTTGGRRLDGGDSGSSDSHVLIHSLLLLPRLFVLSQVRRQAHCGQGRSLPLLNERASDGDDGARTQHFFVFFLHFEQPRQQIDCLTAVASCTRVKSRDRMQRLRTAFAAHFSS